MVTFIPPVMVNPKGFCSVRVPLFVNEGSHVKATERGQNACTVVMVLVITCGVLPGRSPAHHMTHFQTNWNSEKAADNGPSVIECLTVVH